MLGATTFACRRPAVTSDVQWHTTMLSDVRHLRLNLRLAAMPLVVGGGGCQNHLWYRTNEYIDTLTVGPSQLGW
jgi:hypothetical protein